MMYDDDDALDRALFALPLEEPPSTMRAQILAATVYRQSPAFSIWDCLFLGSLAAVAVWLVALIAMGGGSLLVQSLGTIAVWLERVFSSPATLAWLAAGGATAYWLSVFTGSQPAAASLQRSAGRVGR